MGLFRVSCSWFFLLIVLGDARAPRRRGRPCGIHLGVFRGGDAGRDGGSRGGVGGLNRGGVAHVSSRGGVG